MSKTKELINLCEEDEQYTVTVKEITLVDKSIDILRTAKNKRQLDNSQVTLSKIQNLKKEYDSFIERLEK